MTGQGDGATATGGMSGITEDTPGHAGAPGEAGGIDGVSAAGADPGTYDVSGNAADAREVTATGEERVEADEITGRTEPGWGADEADDGLVTGDTGGVTGTSDL